jgi:hypothetical protein
MLFFSVSRCAEALCQKTIQLLVQDMLACARERTWIPVEWPTSLGGRLYAYYKCGNILVETVSLRIILNIDVVPVESRSHTHPSHL